MWNSDFHIFLNGSYHLGGKVYCFLSNTWSCSLADETYSHGIFLKLYAHGMPTLFKGDDWGKEMHLYFHVWLRVVMLTRNIYPSSTSSTSMEDITQHCEPLENACLMKHSYIGINLPNVTLWNWYLEISWLFCVICNILDNGKWSVEMGEMIFYYYCCQRALVCVGHSSSVYSL